jgi:phosphoribosyl-AMP cyclohydrolase
MSKAVDLSVGWLDAVGFDDKGLVTAIAQDHETKRVLMVAWMTREALSETARTGFATYFSRSRGKLWRKGEESGHRQKVHSLHLDCDGDVIVLMVSQEGGLACHTGRESCFFYELKQTVTQAPQWVSVDPVLKDPALIYKKS